MSTFLRTFNEWFDDNTPRFGWLALVVMCVTGLMSAFLLIQPSISARRNPEVILNSGQERPNVIFIVADALSASDMSLFGYDLPTTPRLNEITASWSVYSNAQSPLTCTVAALPSLMTGRYPYTTVFSRYGDLINRQTGWISLPQVLNQSGYQTWWVGYLSPGFYRMGSSFDHSVCRSSDGLHHALNRSWFKTRAIQKQSFPFVPFLLDQFKLAAESAEDMDQCGGLDSLQSVLQQPSMQAPYFIYFHYDGVHGVPYPTGDKLGTFLPVEAGLVTKAQQREVYGEYPLDQQAKVDQLRLRYDESILQADQDLGAFLDWLKQAGLYDSSMIIITADHGQSFENGVSSHCTTTVAASETHVPILIKYPHQATGTRSDDLVSTVDLAPTILDTLGFRFPAGWFDGISLRQQADAPVNDRVVVSRRPNYLLDVPQYIAVSDRNFTLVQRNHALYLFDNRQDARSRHNLFREYGYDDLLAVLRLKQTLENYADRTRLLQKGENILDAPPLVPPGGN